MEPIPETLEAIGELEAYLDDGTLLDVLKRAAARAREIAPDLTGVSVASKTHGLTFTLVATDDETAALDGVQYVTGGPCVDAMDAGEGIATTSADLLNEERWRALGQAGAAAGVRSTLTFPILSGAEVVGTVNLYGRSDDAFDDRHRRLADVFRGWAPGAVTNADLSFSTRRLAERAPEKLRDDAFVDAATGVLSARHDVTLDAAREQLAQAARRAGIPVAKLAQSIIRLRENGSG